MTMKHEEVLTTVLFVIALGPDAYKDPIKFPTGAWCKEGDFVLVRPHSGSRLIIHGKEFRIINDDSVEATTLDSRGLGDVYKRQNKMRSQQILRSKLKMIPRRKTEAVNRCLRRS